MVGNTWKQVVLNAPYTVTADTVLTVTFSSGAQGEIHGIGFDTDNGISANRTFQLYGTQTWGHPDATDTTRRRTGRPTRSRWGACYTGTFPRLIFAMDHDVANATGESVFSNISITTTPVDSDGDGVATRSTVP